MQAELSSFEQNSSIVTASPLLAAVVARQFAETQLRAGISSWERPSIQTIDAWLTACWHEVRYASLDIPALLSASQERLLWQSVIREENPDLFDVSAAARLARDAMRIVAEWHVPLDSELWIDHQDGQQFLRWGDTFRARCRREGWITRSDLWRLCVDWIRSGLCSPTRVGFLGFTRLSPAIARLHDALPGSEFLSTNDDRVALPKRFGAIACNDFKSELEKAARWSRHAFENGLGKSIAVFVPDLRSHLDLVDRIFREVCYPSWDLGLLRRNTQPSDLRGSVFHVNGSRSRLSHPLISSALLVLSVGRPRIQTSDAAALLRCPFIKAADTERSERAFADLNLRRMRELDVSLHDLERASRKCPILTQIWSAVRRVLQSGPWRADLQEWSKFFGDLVQAAGWPGDAELTADDQEQLEAWNDALSSLASLGMVSAPVTLEVAFDYLRSALASDGTHRGDWFSPIQIIDASEAVGLSFDCAFVAGLSDEMWPPRSHITPLIPLRLQRSCNVPGSNTSDLQSERDFLTRVLFDCAPVIRASYHGRLSSLAARFLTQESVDDSSWTGLLPIDSFAPVALEEVEDDFAPAFDVSRQVYGGTSIIKLQSLCPFRAFAEIRLKAQSPEDACFGFDARDRGGFLHKALQYVWQELKTQATLNKLPDEWLKILVRESVAKAVAEDLNSPFRVQTTLVERERLEYLILDWLVTVEKNRPRAFTVETVEDQLEYNLAGLPLRLRIDRMDRLDNGQVLLIDYKSGKQTRGKLDSPRPFEPQLLVYASAKGPEVDGFYFGEVRPREMRVVGYGREKYFRSQSATAKNESWDSYAEKSRDEVHSLAKDFLAGKALVDPLRGACEYCSVKPFCRIKEKSAEAEEEA